MSKPFRSTMIILLITLAFFALFPCFVLAEDEPEADFTTSFYSQYVWRGWAYSDSSLVIQPSMTVSYNGFGVNLWGNLDTDEVGTDSHNWNETDLTFYYEGSAGTIGYEAGWMYYNVDGEDDSQEVYISANVDTILTPTLTFYSAISSSSSSYYLTMGISHSIPVTEEMALDLGAQMGFMDDEESDYSEFHDGLISAAMTFSINDYVSLTPELYYSFALTSDSKTAISFDSVDSEDDHLFGGVSAGFSF